MSILGTAVSGLLAYQRALATTGHNIANASTQGYSRQRVELEARSPQMLGGNYIGQGVDLSAVRRLQNDLVDAQLRGSLSDFNYGETRAAFSERMDRLLADDSTGLEPVLESYFNAVQDVASDPTSIPARTVMLNEAETFVERLSQLHGQIEEQRTLLNGSIETTVEEINQYSKSLADLNARIISGFSAGSTPNDLLDQRDIILNKLSEKLDVSVNAQDDGSVNVFIGNGQPLVMGGVANALVAKDLANDPVNLEIGLQTAGSNPAVDVTRFMTGGEIGGLIETRTGMLDVAQNELGLIGLNLAIQFNDQNALGLDFEGNPGGDIFDLPDVEVSARTTNAASEQPTVTITDVTQLTASDYRLDFDGTDYRLSRIPSNEPVDMTETVVGSGIYASDDGLTIDLSAMASAATPPESGDQWVIQPTRFAAAGLGVVMTEPEKIAAAAAVTAEPSELNTGEATIESVRALDADNPLLMTKALVIRDSTAPNGYTVNGVAPTSVSTKDGITTITANGWELKIKGEPADDDVFVVEANDASANNADFKGDNRNMLAMAEIQNLQSVGGTKTIEGSHTSLLAQVGTQTRQAQIARDSSATLLEVAQAQREEISGVNLDEEAANLIRYQQAYQAAAQVVAVSRTLFDTLINAVR